MFCRERLFGKKAKHKTSALISTSRHLLCQHGRVNEETRLAHLLGLTYGGDAALSITAHSIERDFNDCRSEWLMQMTSIERVDNADLSFTYKLHLPLTGGFCYFEMQLERPVEIRIFKQHQVSKEKGSNVSIKREEVSYICLVDKIPLGMFLNQFREKKNVDAFLDYYYDHYKAVRDLPQKNALDAEAYGIPMSCFKMGS